MKKLKKRINVIIVFLLLFSINITVFGKVLEGFKQVISTGGEKSQDGVSISKTIEESNLENYFDITLTVKTQSTIEEILKAQDLAIVVVMDISNSMIDSYVDSSKTTTRLEAAQEAGKKMIEIFAESSKNAKDANRNIGYVAFNSDATKVFDLQECRTDEKETELSNTIINNTNQIILDNLADKNGNYSSTGSYDYSYKRYTNIEAGLKLADDMLAESNIENKYVIFISDGYPTTYIKENYTGYNPYTPNATSSGNGDFYNSNLKLPCSYGVDYSDIGARKAETLAKSMKNKGITIFSVGTGIDYQNTIQNFLDRHSGKNFSTVDTDTSDYAVGPVNDEDKTYFKAWLQNDIGSGYYYDTTNAEDLINAYNTIFEKIREIKEEELKATWVANDPMNKVENVENIKFVGIYNKNNELVNSVEKTEDNGEINTASFIADGDKINWDLKKSSYTLYESGNIKQYIYQIKYRIRLANEKSDFIEKEEYQTNGTTTLTYVVRINNELSSNKYLNFPIPSVLGYLGDIKFTKTSNFNGTKLKGAKFELIHNTENCPCQNELEHATIEKYIRTSDEFGVVSFENVPSGHIYKLIEIEAPDDHNLDNTEHKVVISYGKVIIDDVEKDNYIIENTIKTSNLNVKKTVKGNESLSGKFKFEIKLTNDGNPLVGNYKYQINNKTDYLTFNENGISNFELSHNEEITIFDLPYGIVYEITEKNTDGYQVKYCLNATNKCLDDLNIQNGKTVNSEISENNNIEFVNITSFELPNTGSSGELILVIIGIMSLIVPIIYISYSLINNRKESRV